MAVGGLDNLHKDKVRPLSQVSKKQMEKLLADVDLLQDVSCSDGIRHARCE